MQEVDKISILVDNNAQEGFASEHGLALLLESGGRRVLFDAGQGDALRVNAAKRGVDLSKLDAIVLSHGHYDHTGGLKDCPGDVPVYCHPEIATPHFSIHDGVPKDISMFRHAKLALKLSELHEVGRPQRLFESMVISGSIPRRHSWEDAGGPFFRDAKGVEKDVVPDDMALWIETKGGLIVCLGCCHSGLINTLSYSEELCPGKHIRAIVGGLHLLHADEARLAKTIEALRRYSPDVIIPCHCSGDSAVKLLQSTFGGVVSPGSAGMILDFN